MLKQRIITAVILIPLFLALLFYATSQQFCIITAFIALVAAGEWAGLMQIKKIYQRILYVIIVAIAFFAALFVPTPIIFSVAFVWWLIATVFVISYPNHMPAWRQHIVVRGVMGLFVLVPCWAALNYIRNQSDGLYSLLFLFILIWGADTVAYFVGKKWGKTKLAPQVSPGKSREGVIGALIFAALAGIAVLAASHAAFSVWPWVILLTVTTAIFSVIGDLFESMQKREVGVKDSSQLLPGHGGLLDRIDSLTAAAPIFALGGWLLGSYLY